MLKAKLSSKVISLAMSVVLAVGLMPLPAYALGTSGEDATLPGSEDSQASGAPEDEALEDLIEELADEGIDYRSLDEHTQRQLQIMAQRGRSGEAADAEYPVELDRPSQGDGLSVQESEFPSSYDSRTRGIVTPVRDQGSLGTCWAFSMAQSAETGWAAEHPGERIPDLSEWQLAYFTYHRPIDALSNTAGDSVTKTAGSLGSYGYYDSGNTWLATFNLANGAGLAHESAARYDVLEETMSQNYEAYLNDDKCYHADAFELSESYVVEQDAQPELLKRMIIQNGAGTLFFTSSTPAYNLEKGSYYAGEQTGGSGHFVTVVGWDDSYSRENFGGVDGSLALPQADGAWLAKNSWGEEWGNGGYFWISYEEPSLGGGRKAVFYDMDAAGAYDHQYYYDGTMSYVTIGADDDVSSCYEYSANVFTAQQDETIKAISFYTIDNDTDYEVSLYKNPDNDNPASGQLVASGITGSKAIPGYRRVALDAGSYVDIDKGERFSVVVKETKQGNPTPLYIDCTQDNDWIYNSSSAHEGESFISHDLTSWDFVSQGEDAGNMRIKAFTSVRDSAEGSELSFSQSAYEIAEGMSGELAVLLDGRQVNDSALLSFASSDNSVVRVSDLGVVYPQAKGSAEVTVRYRGQTATCTVNVAAAPVTSIDAAAGYATQGNPLEIHLGDSAKMEYAISPKGCDAPLSWSASSVNGGMSYGFSVSDTGTFRAYYEGLYKVTASYLNAAGQTISRDFYVQVSADTVECSSAEDMRCLDYDNRITRSLRYTGEPSESGYVLTFADDCMLESGYDYVYLLSSSAPITGQAAYNAVRNGYAYGVTRTSYTGSELAGAQIAVYKPYFALVLNSDANTNARGFSVESIQSRIAPTAIDFSASVQNETSIACGQYASLPVELSPAGAFSEIVYEIYDYRSNEWMDSSLADGVVRIDGERMLAQKIGKAKVRACASNDGYLRSREVEVEVTPTGVAKVELADEGPIDLARNAVYQLGPADSGEPVSLCYSSDKPTVAYVDASGEVTAVGVGTATVTAACAGNPSLSDQVTVNVYAPEQLTADDLSSPHPYVYGMNETYVYRGPSDAEVTWLYFNDTSFDNGAKLSVQDKTGSDVEGSPFTSSLWGKWVRVPGNEAQVNFDASETYSWSGNANESGTRASQNGFRVYYALSGKSATGVHVDDVNLVLGSSEASKVSIVPSYQPAGAVDAIQSVAVREQQATDGSSTVINAYTAYGAADRIDVYARAAGTAKVEVTTVSGLTDAFDVTVAEAPKLSGATVLAQDGSTHVDKLELEASTSADYAVACQPEDKASQLEAASLDNSIAFAYLYDDNGAIRLGVDARKAGKTVVRLSANGTVLGDVPVTVVGDEQETLPSGSWGTCSWEINGEGMLTIGAGTGTDVLAADSVPWHDYCAQIRSVATSGTVVFPSKSGYLFSSCENLVTADLSNCDTSGVTDMSSMFDQCVALEQVKVGPLWSTTEVTESSSMFGACTSLVGGNGTVFDASHIDAQYARIDVAGIPGYLTGVAGARADISGATVATAKSSYLYTGSEITPDVVVKLGENVIPDTAYDIGYSHNEDVGTATVTVTGKGAYKGEATASFAIFTVSEEGTEQARAAVEGEFGGLDVSLGAGETALKLVIADKCAAGATPSEAAKRLRVGGVADANFKVFDVSLRAVNSTGDELRTLDGEEGGEFGEISLVFDVGSSFEGCLATVSQVHVDKVGHEEVISHGSQTVPSNGKITVPGVGKLSEFAISLQAQHAVTFDSAGGSAVPGQSVADGGVATKPDDPSRSGYTFKGWQLEGAAYDFAAPVTGDITLVAAWEKNAAPVTPAYQTMHRLYNPNSGEHFYTASASERDMLRGVGWAYEGEGWKAPVAGADVYRLYNANAGDHHYTTSAAERDYLVRVGWSYEGVGWKSGGSKPLYRQYNPNAVAGSHNYTTSKSENDFLVGIGWRAEGIGWYGV